MKILFSQLALYSILIVSMLTQADTASLKEKTMKAEGTFEVSLDPIKDDAAPAGRMIIRKTYSGDIEGTGSGQMLSKRTEAGESVYAAIEEFEGSLGGKSGSFTLFHNGVMSKDAQRLEINIVAGSGKGELETISGSLDIIQKDGKHFYLLDYKL